MLTSKNRICRSTTEHWLNVQPTRFSRQAPDQILYTFCVCSRVYGTDVYRPPEGLQKWRLRRRRRWNEPAADGRVAAHLGVLHALDLPAARMAAPGEGELFPVPRRHTAGSETIPIHGSQTLFRPDVAFSVS